MRSIKECLAVAVVTAVGLAASGCDSFFEVRQPNIVDAETIDPTLAAPEFANSAYQNLLVAYGGMIVNTGWLTNEGRVGDTFPTRNEIGRRAVVESNSTVAGEVWSPLVQAMATAHDALAIMESLDDKDRNINVARAAFAAGYSIQLVAETFCTGVAAPSGPEADAATMLVQAAQYLQRARDVALAGAAAATTSTTKAPFNELANSAKIALARSYLQAGKKTEAITAVNGIPSDFVHYARYVNDPAFRGRLGNTVFSFRTSRVSFVVGPEWRAMADEGDSRITWENANRLAQDGHLQMYAQKKYVAWDSPIRLTSGLEARYIEVEARGDVAEIVAFINTRRATSGQPGVFSSTTLTEAMRELMAQRSREFWLEGKRLGDWRRQGAAEDFPYILKATDEYYKSGSGPMGDATCFPLPRSERNANPNIKKK